jgi:hypothetical protein
VVRTAWWILLKILLHGGTHVGGWTAKNKKALRD